LREELIERIELICPRCRHAGGEGIVQSALQLGQVFEREEEFIIEGFLVCTNTECHFRYPIIKGVPVILKDIEGWWYSEKSKLSRITCGTKEIQEFFAALNKKEPLSIAEKSLLSSYMDLHYGDFPNTPAALASMGNPRLFRDKVLGVARPATEKKYQKAIELGCSVGRYTFEIAHFSNLSIGIDLNFNAVSSAARFQRTRKVCYERKRHGRHFEEIKTSYSPPQNVLFLVADTLDPPFGADFFDLVLGLNLVDNIKLPLVLIGQMDALLRKGGTLILAAPYEWRPDISEPSEWLENDELDAPEMVRGILEGKMFPQMGLEYEIVQELFDVPWVLRHHDRYWSYFLVHLIKARKIASIS
jgi:SAM-dependent methyltransferase/uncharacterized protein YbaR (Trm112 family)